MDTNSLSTLYSYNAYANELLFQTVIRLTDTQLDQDSSPSRGNVRTLLIHMYGVEKYFLSACQGTAFEFNREDYLDIINLISEWKSLAKEQVAYLDSLVSDDLDRDIDVEIRGRNFRLRAWQLLTQALVHSIHHRGELSIVLSELGHPLPTSDPILLFVRQSGQEWPWD